MGWPKWQNRQLQRQQQKKEEEEGRELKKHGRWDTKLSSVRAPPLNNRFISQEPEWIGATGKTWKELPPVLLGGYQLRSSSRYREGATAPHQQEKVLRVSFPLKLGIALGTGRGVDFTSLALRIVDIKVGSHVCFRCDESAGREDVMRQKGHWQRLDTTGNLMNAASVLLLSQALYGPVVAIAMTCMAGAGFTRFVMSKISRLLNQVSESPIQLKEAEWPSRFHDFSTASLLLSIGVPILKRQYPLIHKTLEWVGAGIPISLGYTQTRAQVKYSPGEGDGVVEKLWRQRHRWAARLLYGYLEDFQHPSKVGWLVDIWEKTTVIVVPSFLCHRTSLIGSIPLPIRPSSKQHSTKTVSLKAIAPVKRSLSTLPSANNLDIQSHHSLAEAGGGQLMASSWGEGTNNSYLEFHVVQSAWRRLQEKTSLIFRGCYLLLVFGPLIIFGPIMYFMSTVIHITWGLQLRKVLWWVLRFCLEKGGAAFIKWGQWSATREDLFPDDLCHYLGRLHDQAPEHSYTETKKAVQKNLGRSIEDIFEDFPQRPCASGSIAQVYRAKLKDHREGMPAEVAVKVRHPSVALRISQDFQIMAALANWAQEVPALRWLKLRESIDQFSHTLTAQTDLRVEAENLAKFHQNFKSLNHTVIFPKLIPDLVSEGVIVEGFEPGQSLNKFLRNRTALNAQIAAAGVDTYLKMLLTDNFVHTDLHPGNILARCGDDGQSSEQKLQLVLLDFGLAEELTPAVRYHFLSFIMMIGAGNGERAAHHLLQFSWPHEQACRNPGLLVEDMKYLFDQECNVQDYPIDLNKVLIKVLQLCRRHEVTIDSEYASLVVAVCVLVGFARSLDPELSIMDAAVPCLFFYNLTGQIMGQIYG